MTQPDTLQKPGRLWLRFRHKLALYFGGIVLVSTLLAIALSYVNNLRHIIDQFGKSLFVVANSCAVQIERDPAPFLSLHDPSQMSGAAYKKLQQQLRSAAEVAARSNVRLRYLYTMAPTDKPDTWRYVVDLQPERYADGSKNPDFSPLGQTEQEPADDVIRRCFVTKEPQNDHEVKDYPIWGPLLSVAVPIRDPRSHKVIGIVGCDAPVAAVGELRNQIRQTAVICLGLGVVIVLAGSWSVARQVTRPIDALVTATEKIAEGDLNYEVHIAGRDELGQLGDAFNRMTAGLRLRDLYKHQFGRYVSRQIADTILAEPERDFWQGERRKATILFSDIRGFTAMSEKLEPEEVVRRLNEYLAVMVDITFAYDGTLDKFIGDAIMAVFGAPLSTGNDEERAVRAAIDMQEAVRRLEAEWSERGMAGFRIGIGIDTGDVVVGNIGSERRLEYAAIGDHVNLASRLEGLNKEYGTGILISEQTYQYVAHLVEARLVDRVTVRGREEMVNVYEVLGLREGVGSIV